MAPIIGSRVKDEQAAMWLDLLALRLEPDEEIFALSKLSRSFPTCDGFVVTSSRVGGFWSTSLGKKGLLTEMLADLIVEFRLEPPSLRQQKLVARGISGQDVVLGSIPEVDGNAVLSAARRLTPPSPVRVVAASLSGLTPAPADHAHQGISLVGELRGLATLRAEGVLSEAEFAAAKQSVISRFARR